jgi:hypothetical protein
LGTVEHSKLSAFKRQKILVIEALFIVIVQQTCHSHLQSSSAMPMLPTDKAMETQYTVVALPVERQQFMNFQAS